MSDVKSLWTVYMLHCHDGTLYTGISNDLVRRLWQHNHSKQAAKYTRARRPVRLIYYETCDSRSAALKREHVVRKLPVKSKQGLIHQANYSQADGSMADCQAEIIETIQLRSRMMKL